MTLSRFRHATDYTGITDDVVAVDVLTDLGILDALNKAPPALPWTWLAAYHHHPTLHVFAQKFEGLPNPADNGYVVHLFPKGKYSEALARQSFRKMCEGMFDDETVFSARLVTVPKRP